MKARHKIIDLILNGFITVQTAREIQDMLGIEWRNGRHSEITDEQWELILMTIMELCGLKLD